MLKSLETRRDRDHTTEKDESSLPSIARSRRSRNRHKRKERRNEDNTEDKGM